MIYQVFIVDDEEIVCRGLSQFVKWKKHGFEVAGTAFCVDDALAQLKHTHVDVVFMDIRMPGKTGLDLLKILQEEYPDIKSVILSGFSDFSYAREALRLGAVDYLTKPVQLQEIEALLDRLRADFEQLQEEARVHANRLEDLLLSAARGHSALDTKRLCFSLPSHYYVLCFSLVSQELSEAEISDKKAKLRGQISALLPGSPEGTPIFINDEIFSMFVIFPCKSDAELDSFLEIMEQFCLDLQDWICGISMQADGANSLHTAYEEAGRALRYRRAGAKSGVILYRNIKALFSQSAVSLQDVLPDILCKLTDPDMRREAPGLLQNALTSSLTPGLTLTQYQTACIHFLIEINSYFQGQSLQPEALHAELNAVLGRLMLCQNYGSSADCMMQYLNWLIDLLNQDDEQQLGKGAIREIQLYIRQHYQENITLNSLAERFFLHPNYLSRLFKEKTGENFVEYLTEVRMERVKELLRNSDRKIIEICAMTGYDNPRYFSKVFKQYTGMTPKEYREKQEA